MIKHLLSFSLLLAAFAVKAQSFSVTYSFVATTSVSGTTDPSIPPTATGITCGSFVAVGTSTNPTATGRFSFTNWPTGATTAVDTYSTMTGALDAGKYYEVTLTPDAGYELTLTDITFGVRRSGTGIRSYAVRSSADTYATNLPASVGTSTNLSVVGSNEFFWNFDATSTSSDQNGSSVTLSGASFTGIVNPITFRFFAWNSEANTGTFSIDNVTFNGSVTMSTGLAKVKYDLNSNLNVYPVPSFDGVVYVETKNAINVSKVEVMDVLGNIISTTTSNDSKVKLNLSDMSSGNYFVKVYSAAGVSTKKITVVK